MRFHHEFWVERRRLDSKSVGILAGIGVPLMAAGTLVDRARYERLANP